MSVRDSLIASAASTITRVLTARRRRGRYGAMKWNSSELWRYIIVVLYLLVVIHELTASR
jgi:hypothetical protein